MTDLRSSSPSDRDNNASGEVETLLKELESKDGVARQRARKRLTDIGHPAVPGLIQIFDHPEEQARWEAAKALVEIADPTAASALVDALEDENTDVRWVAAEGLIVLGGEGLRPLFEALVKRAKSVWLREGARHILHELRTSRESELIAPVLTALNPAAPWTEVAAAAHAALRQIHGGKPTK